MNKDLDVMLDRCIDRMNAGASLKQCLADYPEHARELEPLLRALTDARSICSTMPGATAVSVTRQRLNAAIRDSMSNPVRLQRKPVPWFGWLRTWATIALVLVLALTGFASYWALTTRATPVLAQANFRLLLSDQENAIGDFKSLNISINRIGVLRGGQADGWEVIELKPSVVVDLTRLQSLNAQEIWNGKLADGQYRQVFVYIESASGILKDGTTANVIVPSGNLQISKPFAIAGVTSMVNFVYDVTVIAAGNDYVLLPQVSQSGATQEFHRVGDGELALKVVEGEVAAGKSITLLVTLDGNAVAGALVTVNGQDIGPTGQDGRISFTVPAKDELKVEAVKDNMKGELEIDLEHESEESWFQEVKLTLKVVSGDVAAGNNITLQVTLGGNPVAGALVTVNGADVGTAGQDGKIAFVVPARDELKVEAVKDKMKGELEIDLESEGEGSQSQNGVTGQIPQETRLTLRIVEGEAIPGKSVTLLVSLDGSLVAGALVTVDDKNVGITGQDGKIAFILPYAEELEIKAVKDGIKGELEIDLEHEDAVQNPQESRLTLRVVVGVAAPGKSITLLVTLGANPVAGAVVTVNDKNAGTTGQDGKISFVVPDNEELKIEAVKDALKGELIIDFGHTGEAQNPQESKLTLKVVVGVVSPGKSVTLLVTLGGNPVAGAVVTVNDKSVGITGQDGKLSFVVPDNERIVIRAVKDEMSGALEFGIRDD